MCGLGRIPAGGGAWGPPSLRCVARRADPPKCADPGKPPRAGKILHFKCNVRPHAHHTDRDLVTWFVARARSVARSGSARAHAARARVQARARRRALWCRATEPLLARAWKGRGTLKRGLLAGRRQPSPTRTIVFRIRQQRTPLPPPHPDLMVMRATLAMVKKPFAI